MVYTLKPGSGQEGWGEVTFLTRVRYSRDPDQELYFFETWFYLVQRNTVICVDTIKKFFTWQEDVTRQVFEEMKALYEQNQTEV